MYETDAIEGFVCATVEHYSFTKSFFWVNNSLKAEYFLTVYQELLFQLFDHFSLD